MPKAFGKLVVKIEACKPYSDSLEILMASSTVVTRIIGNTGPNGSSHAKRMSVVT